MEAAGGDVLHCERCTGLLLRGVTVLGTNPPAVDVSGSPHSCAWRQGQGERRWTNR